MSTELLRIDGLCAAAGATPILDRVSLTVAAGETLAVVGESGSGKSMTALAVLGLLPRGVRQTAGAIVLAGHRVTELDDRALARLRGPVVGTVFQEPMTALDPRWTCGDQIQEALELHTPLDRAARRARAEELLREVAIPEPARRLRQYPHELSGGMRQRVCIAMALAADPRLLIADEPTTALDVTVQAQILDLLRRLARARGLGVLFITHDLGVVADLADRIALMQRGRVVETGSVSSIFAHPQEPYTRALLACRPRLHERPRRLPTVAELLGRQG
jgi:ABC-type glutathione transport system ATPase component